MTQTLNGKYFYDDIFLSMTLYEWGKSINEIMREPYTVHSKELEATIQSVVYANEYLAGVVSKIDMVELTKWMIKGHIDYIDIDYTSIEYFKQKAYVFINILHNRGVI
jgi:hypothetical protein